MKNLICRRIPAMLLCLALVLGLAPMQASAAPAWPENVNISAEGGILMDADSGAVLYGKNIHTAYFPASITKILTALVVIENCDLDEIVTFSHNAVFNVEVGSSSAALDVGDQLSVRDCLYAMVLKSANEAANALAEHVGGSIEQFADMMNAKAVSLGCTDSHFNNPSGLNDPNHYTSAHDMALIAQAAFNNDVFVQIDSTLYYDLPPTKRNKEGLRVYPGHRMLKKNAAQYYPGIIGGKTGYTSLAGNTLVTCAERDGMKLVVVVLNGHNTHYTDTRALLDFGFRNFKTVNSANIDTVYASAENDMTIGGLPITDMSILQLMDDCSVSLPVAAEFSDIEQAISYDLPETAPQKAIAQIMYEYGGHRIGSTWLILNEGGASATEPAIEVAAAESETAANPGGGPDGSAVPSESGQDGAGTQKQTVERQKEAYGTGGAGPYSTGDVDTHPRKGFFPAIRIPRIIWVVCGVVLAGAVLTGGMVFLRVYMKDREEADRMARYHRRQQRLEDIGVSEDQFDMLLRQKRAIGPAAHPGYYGKKKSSRNHRRR